MKIALAQLNFFVGDFDGNVSKMLLAVDDAKRQGADLVVFPELATCGYPPRDFLEFDDFIRRSERAVLKMAEAAQGIAIVVGSVSRNPVVEGKDLFNSAYFLEEGNIKHVQHKALLPTYDVFDEYRHFEPAKEFKVVEFQGKKIALSICEDLWNLGNENPLYTVVPLDEMMPQKPDLIVNLSASPFNYEHAKSRIHVLRANVQRYGLPMIYVNQIGSQTDIIFDGGSIVISPDGNIFEEMPYWEECVKTFDLQEVMKGGRNMEQPKDKIALIHDALVLGIRDYFGKLGFKQAILGLSGGIDSAVVAVLAARALGEDNVRALLMPSQFSSDHSVNDARKLAVNLGAQYDIVPIEPIFTKYEETLKPHFLGYPNNVTEENIQARIRGMLLMAMSNKFGNVLLNTTNKSEMAVGYGTLYGDLCGGLSVLADVYKTEVYQLAHFINKDGIVIPENTITKPPSAELRPDQKDSDSLPEYDILDAILYQYIEQRQGPHEIIALGFDEATVRRALRLVNMSEFKRHQAAPVLRVSPKAFGVGRRLPIVGKYLS
ncbi:MAG: NAD+ synthase [Saprospiraceae bacterium]|nr:NAD+ synthase [Saprospiraceae bacterium]MCF8249083.1 NAD+ synthase [Saprospiraceae bacterium]MCF8280950.1 NAD+ synthase [Bacteroidales bacterium]MCF8311105.1 NAD+ synthase [Saprospiraceae bacterium]MCF8440195.1 NAD+ synthase [Saprospiraceae bacterium]